MSFFIPQARTLGDTWLPSEVRRRLVEARAGTMSALLRESDGTDERSASAFAVKGHQFETLTGDEAIAGLDLLAALHAGTLDAFAVVDDQTSRLSPSYWEQQHEAALVCVGGARRAACVYPALTPLEDGYTCEERAAWDLRIQKEREYAEYCFQTASKEEEDIQRSALLWGEDTISNHPDRPVETRYVGAHVLILRDAAERWLKGTKITVSVDRRAKKAPDKQVMARWVEANIDIHVRDVRAPRIRKTWPGPVGTEPTQKAALAALIAVRGPPKKKGRPVGT